MKELVENGAWIPPGRTESRRGRPRGTHQDRRESHRRDGGSLRRNRIARLSLITDALGGVDVCLKDAVYEPLSGADFPAGWQKLDGPKALSFVRQRHDLPRGDLDRVVRQQVVMASLARKWFRERHSPARRP